MMADKMTSINEALAAYGFGPGTVNLESEIANVKVHVIAEVRRLTIKTQFVVVIHPRTQERTEQLEWFREQVDTQYFTDDKALIGIPQTLVQIYRLGDYVLTDEQERHFREMVQRRFL